MILPSGERRHNGVRWVPQLEHVWPVNFLRSSTETVGPACAVGVAAGVEELFLVITALGVLLVWLLAGVEDEVDAGGWILTENAPYWGCCAGLGFLARGTAAVADGTERLLFPVAAFEGVWLGMAAGFGDISRRTAVNVLKVFGEEFSGSVNTKRAAIYPERRCCVKEEIRERRKIYKAKKREGETRGFRKILLSFDYFWFFFFWYFF